MNPPPSNGPNDNSSERRRQEAGRNPPNAQERKRGKPPFKRYYRGGGGESEARTALVAANGHAGLRIPDTNTGQTSDCDSETRTGRDIRTQLPPILPQPRLGRLPSFAHSGSGRLPLPVPGRCRSMARDLGFADQAARVNSCHGLSLATERLLYLVSPRSPPACRQELASEAG